MAKVQLPENACVFQVPLRRDVGASGIYFLLLAGEVVYVGQSQDVYKRIGGHLLESVKHFDSFGWVPCSKQDLIAVEAQFIAKYAPRYNKAGVSAYRRAKIEAANIEVEVPQTKQALTKSAAAQFLGMSEEGFSLLPTASIKRRTVRMPRTSARRPLYGLASLIEYRKANRDLIEEMAAIYPSLPESMVA